MVVHKRKKNVRLRGSKTHGGGSMKKRRGRGHKGGQGMAGTGKRADSKKPSIWKDTEYFGKHGFFRHGQREIIETINIRDIDEQADTLVGKQLAVKDAASYSIDLNKMGINKLLGSGRITKKWKIQVAYASQGAIDAVKEAGGEIIVGK